MLSAHPRVRLELMLRLAIRLRPRCGPRKPSRSQATNGCWRARRTSNCADKALNSYRFLLSHPVGGARWGTAGRGKIAEVSPVLASQMRRWGASGSPSVAVGPNRPKCACNGQPILIGLCRTITRTSLRQGAPPESGRSLAEWREELRATPHDDLTVDHCGSKIRTLGGSGRL